MKIHTRAQDAVAMIQPASRVFVHGAAATPLRLLDALVSQAERFRGKGALEFTHLHTSGPARYAASEFRESFRVSAFFVGPNLRSAMDYERVDYLPCLLSEIPQLLRSGRLPIDVALIQVSPPDQHGYCTLGTSVDVARAAVDVSGMVIAEINPKMPRVHGDGFIHVSRIAHAIEVDADLPEQKRAAPTPIDLAIAGHVAGLVEDGSTLQVGIGSIPDAVLGALKGRKHLGVHTEMWSDGMMELLKCGAVDNSKKTIHPGKTVAGFVVGSRELYDFIHDNPAIVGLDIAYVNQPHNIARNPKVVAINSAVEVDLTGQVCADSIGPQVISGAGGQMDFIRGASLSRGGKPIIALPSRTRHGRSRLVPSLQPGAGVVTTRAHVHYVATEYGVADLYGKTLGQRARALIEIAHPGDREGLERQWRERAVHRTS